MLQRLAAVLLVLGAVVACTPRPGLTVTSLTPEDGATNVAVDVVLSATFNIAVDADTVSEATFTLSSGTGTVAGVVAYDATTRTATFTPSSDLAYATTYTADISSAVTAVNGTGLADFEPWTFTTMDDPDPGPDPEVTNVTVTPATADVPTGGTLQLSVDVTATGGADDSVTWSSSDDTIATVDQDGLVTAEGEGTATITATSDFDDTISGSATITVIGVDLNDVYVDANALPNGNGSQSFPFATIADGVFFVNAGGTVNVAPGTYEETLYVPKTFTLEGAGASSVTIVANGRATGPFSSGAIDVDGIIDVSGLILRGFTLQVNDPGGDPEFAAAMTVYRGASNVTIEDVTIVHDTDDQSNLHGINVGGSVGTNTNVTIRNVTIQATGDEVLPNEFTNGAGVNVEGNVTNLLIDGLTTTGHERGISLDPRNGTISSTTIVDNYAIAEVNRMSVLYDGSGTVTGLNAPSFAAAVGNFTPQYGSNNWFFYKESIDIAIRDSMFNFTEGNAWLQSYVQELDATDQAIRLPVFHIGRANGTPFGIFLDRNLLLQPAIDAAALLTVPATIELQADVTSGALDPTGEPPVAAFASGATVAVAGLTIQGAGGTSQIVAAAAGPVLTIDAADVVITGVAIAGPADVGIVTTAAADGLSVTGSNLLNATALDNTIEATVTATGNYWGDASGPTIATNPAGTGNELIDPEDDVDYDGFLAAPVP